MDDRDSYNLPPARRCSNCNKPLSIWNHSDLCHACQKAFVNNWIKGQIKPTSEHGGARLPKLPTKEDQ